MEEHGIISSGDERESGASGGKLQYFSPRLRVYGTVADLTKGRPGSGTDRSGMARRTRSDRALKSDLVEIGRHPLGFGIYLFNFRPENSGVSQQGRRFGVMADEVERELPQAVSVGDDGYKVVDYAMLGIIVARNKQ